MKQIIHLKGLNGLRAIAAISVMLSHVFQNTFGNSLDLQEREKR